MTEQEVKTALKVSDLRADIEIDGEHYILAKHTQILDLFNQLKAHSTEVEEIKAAVINILRLLGIWDDATNSIREGIKTGDESYLSQIMKSLTGIIFEMGTAQFSKAKQAAMEEKFRFIKDIMHIIDKYK